STPCWIRSTSVRPASLRNRECLEHEQTSLPQPENGLAICRSRCVERYGHATMGAVASSAKTGTAATRLVACNSLTGSLGPKGVQTLLTTSNSGAPRTTLSKPTATTAQASWPPSGSSG